MYVLVCVTICLSILCPSTTPTRHICFSKGSHRYPHSDLRFPSVQPYPLLRTHCTTRAMSSVLKLRSIFALVLTWKCGSGQDNHKGKTRQPQRQDKTTTRQQVHTHIIEWKRGQTAQKPIYIYIYIYITIKQKREMQESKARKNEPTGEPPHRNTKHRLLHVYIHGSGKRKVRGVTWRGDVTRRRDEETILWNERRDEETWRGDNSTEWKPSPLWSTQDLVFPTTIEIDIPPVSFSFWSRTQRTLWMLHHNQYESSPPPPFPSNSPSLPPPPYICNRFALMVDRPIMSH